MDLLENIICGLAIGLVISNIFFPGSFVIFIFSVILFILDLLHSKRRDKNVR